MSPKLIIFDLDGTLIDSRADLAAAVNHARGRYDLGPLTLETVSGYIGDGARLLVERSLQGAAIDLDEALACFKAFYLSNLAVHTYLYEGVSDGLRQLAAAGHQIALLTNKPGEPSRALLNHFGLADLFTAIVGGGDVPSLKPAPDGVFKCLELSGMDAAVTWMVGDHCTDLAVAENAGIRSAFVTYGFGEERGHKPDAYFASFPELIRYFV